MPSRNVYHVVPHGDGWGVRREGVETFSAQSDSEDHALQSAVDIVRTLGIGRVVVHGDDGKISAVHTYDRLPTFEERSWLDVVLSEPVWVGVAAAACIGLGIAIARRD